MLSKGKLPILLGSLVIMLYGVAAEFFGKDAYKELSVFMDVLKKIDDDYVEAPNMSKVQEGAMRGLIEALDPYCSFLSKEQYDSLQKRRENGKAGTGIILSKRSEVIYVVACERGSTSEEAGVRPGDYLISVDGQGVESKSILEVDSLLHGVSGAKVKLSIIRPSQTKPLDIQVALRNQPEAPIKYKMLDGNIGWLSLASLNKPSLEQAKLRLKTLISAGASKLILDLRDCADGTPAEGAELANYFLRNGMIYYSQNRKGEKIQVVEANPDKFITDLPMAVLINGSTASAAEIVAGALKDQKRATVVGEKSFGVGSAQKTIQLKSGGILILSVAKYYTPSGKAIQDESARTTGIQPDVLAPDNEKRQELQVDAYYDEKDDIEKYRQLQDKIDKIQLDTAVEVLTKEAAPVKKAA